PANHLEYDIDAAIGGEWPSTNRWDDAPAVKHIHALDDVGVKTLLVVLSLIPTLGWGGDAHDFRDETLLRVIDRLVSSELAQPFAFVITAGSRNDLGRSEERRVGR